MKKPLWLFFTLALIFLWIGTALFPQIRVWTFAPFLAILFHRVRFFSALWISSLCGLLVDLFSSEFPFGLFALLHSMVTFLLYTKKRHFFEDKPIAFSLYSALISSFLSLSLTISCFFCARKISFTFTSFFLDFTLMSIVDMLYAFLWFVLPTTLYVYIQRYWLLQKLSSEEE